MARNQIFIRRTPAKVFDVLADPDSYGHWVVGSHEIRTADDDWPEPGSAFGHSVGLPPLLIKDETRVVRSRRPEVLELQAKARPFPSARITLRLERKRSGTLVTMVEDPANWLLNLLAGPLGHAAIRVRNAESLRRLKELAENER
jgi:uncharacterized protein YndB with AHSA1/START domain